MAIDAVDSMDGNILTWMKTGQRIINSLGKITGVCIEKSNTKKMAKAVDDYEQFKAGQVKQHEECILISKQKHLEEIGEKLEDHIKQVSAIVDKAKEETAQMEIQNISTSEFDRYIDEETNLKKNIMQKSAQAKMKHTETEQKIKLEKIKSRRSEREIITKATESVRQYLKEAIDSFDDNYKNSTDFQELDRKLKSQLEEHFRLLQRHYQKQFKI